MPERSSQDVSVALKSFNELASEACPLALDTYQRAYVWGEDKIHQLLTDLTDFVPLSVNKPPINKKHQQEAYYMGTLLMHAKTKNKGNCLCVIDGQQRLTSLAILYWQLTNELPSYIKFEFRSSHSLVNIQQAKDAMSKWLAKHNVNRSVLLNIFSQLRFTVISVTKEDLAFTFFDTQNNRGVPLGSTDLLKAYHLREINSDDGKLDEQLQSHCATRWETVQLHGKSNETSKQHDFAPELFHYYLWRSRNWTGNQVVELESKDEMLSHFGDRTKSTPSGEVALYPAGQNQWGQTLRLTASNDFYLTPSPQQFGAQVASLPFALRQPVSKGAGFFLYAEKYAAMLNGLFYTSSSEPEIKAMQVFYNEVVLTLSHYLQSLFRLCVLVYFDRLGSLGLLRFVLWLDHRLGAIRLSQADIRRETPLKFLRDAKRNLLDVIAYAYESDDVIYFLSQKDVSKSYQLNDGWEKEIKNNRLVQERYASRVATYYELQQLTTKTPEFIDAYAKRQLAGLNTAKNKDAIDGRV
jgi:hypothetical protein